MTKTKQLFALAFALPLLAVATACDPVAQLPLSGPGGPDKILPADPPPPPPPPVVRNGPGTSQDIAPAYPPPPPPPPPVAVDRV